MTKKILIITASEVKNLELAKEFETCINTSNAEAKILSILDLNLPLYSTRTELFHKAEDLLNAYMKDLKEAQGMVFIAPEYNGSTPPSFSNFLAWVSRSSSHWRDLLNGKPAALATFSGGGGQHVLLAMRTQLSFMGMNVLGRQILTHNSKALDIKSLQLVCQELVKFSGVVTL